MRRHFPFPQVALALWLAALPIIGSGCESNDGPLEEAGEEVDEAVDDAEDAIDDAKDELD
jgi:hypothetical protein